MHHYSLRRFLVLFVPLLLIGVALAALLLFSLAYAQAAPTVGTYTVPDYLWTLGTLLIAWLTKEFSSPITALLKKRFGFEGNVTRIVYLTLSVLFVGAVGLATGAFGHGAAGWSAAAGAVALAFAKGLGDYVKQQQASAGATATPTQPEAPKPGEDSPPLMALEPLHDKNGVLIGYVQPLTSAAQEVTPTRPKV